MKRIILFIILLQISFLAISQNDTIKIDSKELNNARQLTYELLEQYNNYSNKLHTEEDSINFSNLFESDTIKIFNEYIPMESFQFKTNPNISVANYCNFEINDTTKEFRISFENIKYARIVNQEYYAKDTSIIFNINFKKTLEIVDKNSKRDQFKYPILELRYRSKIKYNINNKKIKFIEHQLDNLPDNNQVVIITDKSSKWESEDTIKQCKQKIPTRLIKYIPKKFDSKVFEKKETIVKNTLGLLGSFNYGIPSKIKINDGIIGDFNKIQQYQHEFHIGIDYYRELFLKNRNRFGIGIGLTYQNYHSNINSTYNAKYYDIDLDGGRYERIININNYKEIWNIHSLSIPLSLRYDYFINKNIGFHAIIGTNLNYNIFSTIKASGDAYYAGYYDWLYDVIIDKNGIYDFGSYNLTMKSNINFNNRLSAYLNAKIGLSYYINYKLSIDASLLYSQTIYSKNDILNDYCLSKNIYEWNSMHYALKNTNKHRLGIEIKLNYNF